MIISDLEHKKIAIWGLGTEGMASYHYLRKQFPDKKLLLINQTRPENLPKDDLTAFVAESEAQNHVADIDIIIKTPGISLYHPLTTAFKKQGITISSASNIWFATPRKAKVIAITGSNGKSTTSSLLAHILTHMGLKAELGGNIGTPLLSLPDEADYYVIELSSYQTADLNFAPDIAVLLNLFPEHIQWHLSHEQYYKDKCHLIETGAGTVILNRTDPLSLHHVTAPPKNIVWFNDPMALHADQKYVYAGKEILGYSRNFKIPGAHNLENLCAALSVCQQLGLNLEDCLKQATSFKGLPHRLENLGRIGAHFFINDSISTTPEATLAALKSFEGRDITLIAGGQDRKQDYSDLAQYVKNHAKVKVVTVYETGPRLYDKISANAPAAVFKGNNLEEAIRTAVDITPETGIILLSPSAPSYDAFKNYIDRGQQFTKMIHKT